MATKYIATTGSDSTGDGSIGNPWKTFSKGASMLSDGDTLYARAGTYGETFTPLGGSVGSVITYSAYTGETVTISGGSSRSYCILVDSSSDYSVVSNFTLTGWTDDALAIDQASNVSLDHITITAAGSDLGIVVTSSDNITLSYCTVANQRRGIVVVAPSESITIDHCTVYDSSEHGIDIEGDNVNPPDYLADDQARTSANTDNITITNCESYSNDQQGFWISQAYHVLVEDCISHDNGWTGIQIESGCRYVAVRGCTCYSNGRDISSGSGGYNVGDTETGIWFDETVYGLVYDCDMYDNPTGLHLSQAHYVVAARNRIHENDYYTGSGGMTSGISIRVGDAEHHGATLGVVKCAMNHNTLYKDCAATSGCGEVSIVTQDESIDYDQNNTFINNIVSECTGPHDMNVVYNNAAECNYNQYYSTPDALVFVGNSGAHKTFAEWQASPYNQDANSQVGTPSMNADFTLTSSSACISAAGWLTFTNGTGSSSKTLIVDDASPFWDTLGGITTGSVIQLQGQSTTATVTSINRSTNTLTIDTNLTWTDGIGVAYSYSGVAPDIGAYEYEGTIETGYSRTFPGSTAVDYLTVPASSDWAFDTNVTVMAIVRPHTLGPTATVFSLGHDDDRGMTCEINSSGYLSVWKAGSVNNVNGTSTTAVTANNGFAIYYSTGNAANLILRRYAYADGDLDSQTVVDTTAYTAPLATDGCKIGNWVYPLTANGFDGEIHRVAVISGTLTEAQFETWAKYQTLPGGTDLLGEWELIGESPEDDLSGNSHSATVTGTTVSQWKPSIPTGGSWGIGGGIMWGG